MFARFDENPAMTLQVIKKTKRYGRTDGRTHGQRVNSIPHLLKKTKRYVRTDGRMDTPTDNVKTVYPTTSKVCGGYNKCICTITKLGHIV